MYDIDDLEGIVAANLKERRAVAEQVELLIEAEIVEFKQWLNTLGVVPVISALREKHSQFKPIRCRVLSGSFQTSQTVK